MARVPSVLKLAMVNATPEISLNVCPVWMALLSLKMDVKFVLWDVPFALIMFAPNAYKDTNWTWTVQLAKSLALSLI